MKRSKKQSHQFKRFSMKGTVTRTLTMFEGMSKDSEDFTIIEQMSARQVVVACEALLDNWENVLRKGR